MLWLPASGTCFLADAEAPAALMPDGAQVAVAPEYPTPAMAVGRALGRRRARGLRLLGVPRRQPNVEALRELVEAHVTRVPFENVSKLHYMRTLGLRTLPHFDLFLTGIERFNFGGTCYATNGFFDGLLVSLGYLVRLCGADMSNPDVHMVSMVGLDGREFLVDVGYAAPLLEPLPRDSARDVVVELGRDRYVLRPQDAEGRSRLDLVRDGEPTGSEVERAHLLPA